MTLFVNSMPILFRKTGFRKRLTEFIKKNPKSGMVSGLVYIEKNSEWTFEKSTKNHLHGPIKSYRVTCFKDMEWSAPCIKDWDNIDVMLAQMQFWDDITIKRYLGKTFASHSL